MTSVLREKTSHFVAVQ